MMSQGTILVIDDSRLVRRMYRHRLVGEAFRVLTADSGEAGLETLRREQIDLVMLDLGLPGMGGIEVLQAIKEDPSLGPIPVLVVSAKEQDSLIEQALELGAREFIAKATTPMDKVIERIGVVLGRDRPDREARHYRLALDPVSLDAHDLAVALGLDCLACTKCGSSLVVELTPEAVEGFRTSQHLDARIICTECEDR